MSAITRTRVGTCRVSVVLPCLNEEAAIGSCVNEAFVGLRQAGYAGEVIVVDNNSTDNSASAAIAAGARVMSEPTRGYGAALRAGFAAADGDVIVMVDGDGSYPIDRLKELVAPVVSGEADVTLGSRLETATAHSMPLMHRYVGTPILTRLVRSASGLPHLTDSQSGFRAFRKSTIDALGLSSAGMELASEMLIRANQRGLRIAEVALGYRARLGESKLNTWRDGFRHLRRITSLGPHIALWYPGLALLTCSAALLIASLFYPKGLVVGAVLWQPVFAASILAVVGACGATVGALLAAAGPYASPQLRDRFHWVMTRRTGRRLAVASVGLVTVGLILDGGLFVRWASGAAPLRVQLQVAALAQVATIVGVVLLMVAALHPLLATRERTVT